MPIYEYRCSDCGFQKEFLQKMSDPLLTTCPECGKETLDKMVTAAGFQLKGSGWYATDFKTAPQKTKTVEDTQVTTDAKPVDDAKSKTESASTPAVTPVATPSATPAATPSETKQ